MSTLREDITEGLEPLKRLGRDLKKAAATLSHDEARYLVDAYYQMQDDRKRSDSQARALSESGEPHEVLAWLGGNTAMLERNIKGALGVYASSHTVGDWSQSILGIGDVLSAGLLAHIDITKAPTVGNIWRYAGLDPTSAWLGTKRATETVELVMDKHGYKKVDAEVVRQCVAWLETKDKVHVDACKLLTWATTDPRTGEPKSLTKASLIKALAKRPHSASLKVLCWKIGESFVKVKGNPKSFYGARFTERWMYEQQRNEAGELFGQAKAKLENFSIGKNTDAYKAYSIGRLPKAHILARAKRWTVKLFLAHWHHVAYESHYGTPPPKPYVLTYLDHAHEVTAPNWPMA
jgi:hypothetical protein